jgi:hypothetical protein
MNMRRLALKRRALKRRALKARSRGRRDPLPGEREKTMTDQANRPVAEITRDLDRFEAAKDQLARWRRE